MSQSDLCPAVETTVVSSPVLRTAAGLRDISPTKIGKYQLYVVICLCRNYKKIDTANFNLF